MENSALQFSETGNASQDGGAQCDGETQETFTPILLDSCSVEDPGGPRKEVGRCQALCATCLRPFTRSLYLLPDNPTLRQKFRYSLLCPPHGRVGKWLTGLLIISLVFGSLVSLLGESALPGSNIFSLFVLFVLAEAAGRAVVPLRLPPLLGMLVVGILLKSVPGLDVIGKNIDQEWSAALRLPTPAETLPW